MSTAPRSTAPRSIAREGFAPQDPTLEEFASKNPNYFEANSPEDLKKYPGGLKPLGRLTPGTEVEAPREPGDDEYERCKIKSFDSMTATVDLDFGGGFVRRSVPLGEIKYIESNLQAIPSEDTIRKAAALAGENAAKADPDAIAAADDALYAKEVVPQLPQPPTPIMLEADAECKYDFIKVYKDVGNGLFKSGKFTWAVRTYTAGVEALATHCYESRERMLWDYFARVPCGQCYSNAALCALKQGDHSCAAALCEKAMECKPEDTDLVKVLLRHGQALLGLDQPEAAKEVLEKAVEKEPNNRAVREELLKAKKAVKALADQSASRLFNKVDLFSAGLTSKKESQVEVMQSALDEGFQALVDHKDDEALMKLAPLLEGQAALTAKHRKPVSMLAAYGVGIVRYQKQQFEEAIYHLDLCFKMKAELDGEGADYTPPHMGCPIARFYLAHALFESQMLEEAKEAIARYFEDVEAAGPQRILNMPKGMLGLNREITDMERTASRWKVRASSNECKGDAHTMLACIAERLEGLEAAVPHFLKTIELGNDHQKEEAHDNIARTYEKMGAGHEEKVAEHRALQAAAHERIEAKKKKDEEEKRKTDKTAEGIKERDAQLEKEENNMEAAKEAAASMEAQAADAKMPDVSDIVGPPPP